MKNNEKINSIKIISHITEFINQTQIIQYYKNTQNTPIELEIVIPLIKNFNLTKFEIIKNNQKIISKLIEKEKAKEKYTDMITTGNPDVISFESEKETKINIGVIKQGEEIEIKTFYFSHIINKDLSYQAKLHYSFPRFIMGDPKLKKVLKQNYSTEKIINGKIYINTRSNIQRLIIRDTENLIKIEKKYSNDKTNVEIDIFTDDSNYYKSQANIIIFRTEKINEDVLYYQRDPRKNKSYYLLQKTLVKPEFEEKFKDEIDEDENKNYFSLLKNHLKIKTEKNMKECFIFLLAQRTSWEEKNFDLICKSLLLFLQSLNENCYFQLVLFSTYFEFFSDKPLEYNKKNVHYLKEIIKNLKKKEEDHNELYNPLKKIYDNKIYDKYEMKKNIILLTMGSIFDQEIVIKLIEANSNKFIFNSIGLGNHTKDLIENISLVGKGFSYYVEDSGLLNSVIINLLDKIYNSSYINCSTNQKSFIEEQNIKFINKNDFFTHGFILDDINLKDIEFNIKDENNEIKLSFDKNKIIKLPDGNNLGKLIVDNYLKNENITKDFKINVSQEYNILITETTFYAKVINDIHSKDDKIEEQNENIFNENNDNIYNNEIFGYDNNYDEEGKKGFFSKMFNNENIIKRKFFIPKKTKIKMKELFKTKEIQKRAKDDFDLCHFSEFEERQKEFEYMDPKLRNYIIDFRHDYDSDSDSDIFPDNKKQIKEEFNFDELILNQDILEGNWTKGKQGELLIEQEKEIYEKIKKYSENKGIKEENGIITLFVLYFIYNKKSDKIYELKYIINKAGNYIRKIFNLEYNDVIKEIETV